MVSLNYKHARVFLAEIPYTLARYHRADTMKRHDWTAILLSLAQQIRKMRRRR